MSEIVCAVSSQFTDEELSCLDGLVDRIIPCEMGSDFLQERYRSWLYAQCTGDWIITVDSDEVPSEALLNAIPSLAAANDVVTYITTVHWSYPDLAHWLDEYPWEPSWKLVMVRNDPATLYIRGGVHEGVMPSLPYRYVDLPIYHLDTAVTSFESRQKKVGFYDSLAGVQVGEDGKAISERYYLPELHSKQPLGEASSADLAAMEAVMAAESPDDRVLDRHATGSVPAHPDTVSYAEILEYWPERPFDETDFQATIAVRKRARTPKEDLSVFTPGEIRPVMVDVHNGGNADWLREARNDVALGSKWFTEGDVTRDGPAYSEGPRSGFTATVHPGNDFVHPMEIHAPSEPGRYYLVIDLVRESVRWFGCGIGQIVNVRPE